MAHFVQGMHQGAGARFDDVVDAPCPLSDFPSIRACTSTCPGYRAPE